MALIKCPECGAQVSSSAVNCPKCAYEFPGQAHGGKIQTVEQVSKRFKLQKLLSIFLVIFSLVAMCSGSEIAMAFGFFGLVIGFIWYVLNRFMTWWHHG